MSAPDPAPQQAASKTASEDAGAVLLLPGRSGWRPETSLDLERFAPDLLQTFNAATNLDPVEIGRRQSNELNPLPVAEPVSYLLNFAYARELVRRGVRPGALAGYSLGEYAALAIAGSIDFHTGLDLVRERAQMISEVIRRNPLRIVRIEGADSQLITELCEEQGDVWPVTYDSPRQMMVGGEPRSLDRVAPRFKEAGAERIVLVLNNGGLHTPPMKEARVSMSERLSTVEIAKPRIPVASSISAQIEEDPERWRELLAAQVDSPVRWQETVEALPEGPLVECGGDRLATLAETFQPDRKTYAVDSLAAIDAVEQQVAVTAA